MSNLENPKWRSLEEAVAHREALRAEGRRVVLTNGCFDLLHTGHIYSLQQSSGFGDALFVAINSARSVRELKGEGRPVQGDKERAYALGALACVDTVVLFDTPRLVAEIEALKPDSYAKAGDYTLETLHPGERGALEACGASVHFIPYLEGYSTTSLIQRIAKAAENDVL